MGKMMKEQENAVMTFTVEKKVERQGNNQRGKQGQDRTSFKDRRRLFIIQAKGKGEEKCVEGVGEEGKWMK